MISLMKVFDNSFLSGNVKLIAGVDEAGRGPLAGPVIAAAVVFLPDTFIEGINDSKILTEAEREALFPIIIEKALSYSFTSISNKKIDELNILQASLLAMHSSVRRLKVKPDIVLLDGNKSYSSSGKIILVVKGDSKSFAIAAASIIAKVLRDRLMKRLSVYHPLYGWEKNKGYPTKFHINAVKQFGPTSLHRKTFLKKILSEQEELTGSYSH